MFEEARVLAGDDRRDEAGRDARERNRPAVDRVALALGPQPLLARADERCRRGVAPAEDDYLGKRDEDEEKKRAA
jgi:hypothetical protein